MDTKNGVEMQGIEPWTTSMLKRYYTTKPHPHFAS